MFSHSIIRSSRLASRQVLLPAASTTPAVAGAARRFKSETIPVTSYTSDKETGSTYELPIKGSNPAAAVKDSRPQTALPTRPITQEVNATLPAILQKFSLHGKVAVVTGGARGLGYNMTEALCQAGVRGVAILDVLQEHGETATAALNADCGVDAQFFKVDVRNADAVHEVVAAVVRQFGQVDILVNSAGIADSNIKAETYDVDMFRRALDINVTGTFLTTQACARAMIEAGRGGSIINIASMSGHIVNYPQQQSAYNASKAAVIQLTKSLAAEWAQYGIRCNAICPGYMDTALNRVPQLDAQKTIWKSLTPQGRLGNVDELNGLAVYLASDASTFMTGADILIDGGYTLL